METKNKETPAISGFSFSDYNDKLTLCLKQLLKTPEFSQIRVPWTSFNQFSNLGQRFFFILHFVAFIVS